MEESLLDTLPRNHINLLNQYLELHDIILPSVFPAGYIHNKEFLDLDDCVFFGPYSLKNRFQVEQRQPD
jgi:hypothetical protein